MGLYNGQPQNESKGTGYLFFIVATLLIVAGVLFFMAKEAEGRVPLKRGDWTVYEEMDPMEDTKEVTFIVRSTTGDFYGNYPAMLVRANKHGVNLIISWKAYINNVGPFIKHRIGSSKPIMAKWGISTDGTATFYPQENVKHLLRAMTVTESFVARVVPFSDNPITVTFDTTGLESMLRIHNKEFKIYGK